MRAIKVAIAAALAADHAVSELVPAAQIFAVERATIPTLPSIEVIGISSELVDTGPMVRHSLSIEVTVRSAAEDAVDEALDAIVRAVRQRLSAAAREIPRISLSGGEGVLVELGGTRWSVSAKDATTIVRGAAISLTVSASE